jgi:membrane protein
VAGARDEVKGLAKALPERVRLHNLTLVAAGVAFYAFLALVPALIAFVSIYGLVADPATVTRQVHDTASALPDEVQRFLVFQLTSIVKSSDTGVSLTRVVATVIALWSASGGIAALIAGIRIAHDFEPPMGFISKRAKALALTVGAIILLSAVVFLVAVLPPLLSDAGLPNGGRVALSILRWPVLAIVMAVGIGLLYRLAIPEKAGGYLGLITLGTVVALVGWLVVSVGFSFYSANFARYSKTYGTLASIVVVLLWLWLSALLVLFGAEVDAARHDAARAED